VYLINADLLTCGVATLIQTVGFWKIGIRLPLIQGVTFAAVTPMVLIGQSGGLTAIYGSVIVAGIITFLISPYFSRLIRFFPPVVVGSIITVIGISLLPVAVRWAGGGDPNAEDFGSLGNIAMAFGVLLIILAINRFFRGFIRGISVLLGLIIGTAIAALFGIATFEKVVEAAPLGITTPFYFGLPTFGFAAILSMTIVMLVTMVETTGNIVAIGEIVDKPVHENDLTRGLRADGLSTALGGVLNAFPYTAFAQNTGLVRLTGVKSRFVVAAAGGVLILLGLFPKLAAVVASVPLPVLGGAGFVLFGTVAAIGIRTLARVDFENNDNLIIVATSLALGVLPVAVPDFYNGFPQGVQIVLNSGITAASIVAIVLNLVFNVFTRREEGLEVAEAAGKRGNPSKRISIGEVNGLEREEFVAWFGPLFEGSPWIAERAWDEHPFESLEDLHRALQGAMYGASREEQLGLIEAHPDLAGKAAVAGDLTPESTREQAAAGLDRLSPEEYESFIRMNDAYRSKFGFPMVVCVREHTKETILEQAEARLKHSRSEEVEIALGEISKIAHLRLQDLVEQDPNEEAEE
jgi:OHCU decarboxylase